MQKLRLKSQPVSLEGVTKRFGHDVAVDAVSLVAKAGELTTLLGPSGCGKTTTLRMIGGFYQPDEGVVRIGDRVVNDLPAHARSTRTVFQSYALFPHMTVFENVAFGLRATGVPRREISGRVEEALELVGLTGLGIRQAGQLSGGQQQRVAFARALITKPEVLLLDEPLSNLDAKLRIQMRLEIRRIQQELGITTIYVTHDQEEAMSLSDHVVVMNAGRIEQQGPAHEIYEQPVSRFVANFIGVTNLVDGRVIAADADSVRVRMLGTDLMLLPPKHSSDLAVGQQVQVVIRPEHLHLERRGEAADDRFRLTRLRGEVLGVNYLGAAASYQVKLQDEQTLILHDPAPRGTALRSPGEQVALGLEVDRAYVLPT